MCTEFKNMKVEVGRQAGLTMDAVSDRLKAAFPDNEVDVTCAMVSSTIRINIKCNLIIETPE